MRRSVLTVATGLSVLALVACGSGSLSDGTAPSATGGESTAPASTLPQGDNPATPATTATAPAPGDTAAPAADITTVDQLKAALAAEHSTEAWYASITDITLETHLGAPVLVLQATWDNLTTDYDTRSQVLDPAMEAINSYDTPLAINIASRDVNGAFSATGGGGTDIGPLHELVALPPAPTTPDELSSWLATVFGPGGLVPLGPEETWYSSITSIAMEDLGNGSQLMVTTTLGPDDKTEQESLALAVRLTGSPLTEMWNVRGSGDFFSAWGGWGGAAPGTGGWFYPLPV